MSISEGKLSMNQFDTIRAIWEGSLNEKKDLDPATVGKIASQTDRNDHNGSIITLANALKDKKAVKMMQLLSQMHKMEGHMTTDMIAIRTGISKDLMKKAEKTYSNYDEIYKSF